MSRERFGGEVRYCNCIVALSCPSASVCLLGFTPLRTLRLVGIRRQPPSLSTLLLALVLCHVVRLDRLFRNPPWLHHYHCRDSLPPRGKPLIHSLDDNLSYFACEEQCRCFARAPSSNNTVLHDYYTRTRHTRTTWPLWTYPPTSSTPSALLLHHLRLPEHSNHQKTSNALARLAHITATETSRDSNLPLKTYPQQAFPSPTKITAPTSPRLPHPNLAPKKCLPTKWKTSKIASTRN